MLLLKSVGAPGSRCNMTEKPKPGAERREVDYDKGQRKIQEYLESGRILRFIMNTPDAGGSARWMRYCRRMGW